MCRRLFIVVVLPRKQPKYIILKTLFKKEKDSEMFIHVDLETKRVLLCALYQEN